MALDTGGRAACLEGTDGAGEGLGRRGEEVEAQEGGGKARVMNCLLYCVPLSLLDCRRTSVSILCP